MDKAAFHTLSCGLFIVTAVDKEGRKVGCVANTLLQVTSKPAQAIIALNKQNVTEQVIEETGVFGVSVLDQDCTLETIGTFGFHSSYETDKFADRTYELDVNGMPYLLDGVASRFSLKVKEKIDAGTHVIFVGEVVDAEKLSTTEPLTYSYYHSVMKGKTPPKASSYIEGEDAESSAAEAEVEDSGKAYGWRCKLCGYIVRDYPDGLPEDFRCPMCGAPASMFERIEL